MTILEKIIKKIIWKGEIIKLFLKYVILNALLNALGLIFIIAFLKFLKNFLELSFFDNF